jgi:hypothetical protein
MSDAQVNTLIERLRLAYADAHACRLALSRATALAGEDVLRARILLATGEVALSVSVEEVRRRLEAEVARHLAIARSCCKVLALKLEEAV